MTSSSLMNYRCQLISDLYFVGLARNNLLIELIAYSQKFCLPVHDIKTSKLLLIKKRSKENQGTDSSKRLSLKIKSKLKLCNLKLGQNSIITYIASKYRILEISLRGSH